MLVQGVSKTKKKKKNNIIGSWMGIGVRQNKQYTLFCIGQSY